MLVGVVSSGKATGATTIAAGLGAAFGAAGHDSLVIEADLSGGDLAYLRDLNVDEAGVLGFAAAMGADAPDPTAAVASHVWRHPGSPKCAVMPLAAGGAGVEAQVAALWKDGAGVLARWPGPVVIDLGRWRPGLCEQIWSGSDVGVVVCSGSVAGLRRSEAGWNVPPLANEFATWRIINGSPWPVETITAEIGLMFEAVLAWDRRAAEVIRLGNWKAARRRHLARQLSQLATEIVTDRSEVGA